MNRRSLPFHWTTPLYLLGLIDAFEKIQKKRINISDIHSIFHRNDKY
jgi:hypothetical protein